MSGSVQNIPNDIAKTQHDKTHKRPGESDQAFRDRSIKEDVVAVAGTLGGPEASVEKNIPKATTNIVDRVVAPDITKSLSGDIHTANIQEAMKRNGVSDFSQIGPAARDLYDKTINPTLSSSPKLVQIDKITDNIVAEMRKMKPGLDPTAAKNAAHSVITDMYDMARGGENLPVPTHIDTPSIFNIKQDLNGTNAVKDYFAGNTPTDLTDMATVASRNALANTIGTAHPEIAQATKDYGLLQQGLPSVYKETNAAIAADAAKKAGADPMKYIGGKALDYLPGGPILHGVGNAVLKNPIGQKALGLGVAGVAGALGMKYLPDIVNSYNDKSTSQASNDIGANKNKELNVHDTSISQGVNPDGTFSVSNLPADKNGVKLTQGRLYIPNPSQIKDATGSTIGVDDNSYNKELATLKSQQADLNKKASDNTIVGFQHQQYQDQYKAVGDKIDALNNTHAQSVPLNKTWENITQVSGQVNSVLDDLGNVSPNVSSLNSTLNDLRRKLTGPYAGLATNLEGIQKSMNGGKLDGATKEALQSQLQAINQQLGWSFYTATKNYVGGLTTPQTNNAYQSNTGNQVINTQLPPITTNPQQDAPDGWASGAPAALKGSGLNLPAIQ